MGIRFDTIQRPTQPKIGDATIFCGHTECSTHVLYLVPEPKESFVVIFPTHQRMSRLSCEGYVADYVKGGLLNLNRMRSPS